MPIFAPGKKDSEMSLRIWRFGGTILRPVHGVDVLHCWLRRVTAAGPGGRAAGGLIGMGELCRKPPSGIRPPRRYSRRAFGGPRASGSRSGRSLRSGPSAQPPGVRRPASQWLANGLASPTGLWPQTRVNATLCVLPHTSRPRRCSPRLPHRRFRSRTGQGHRRRTPAPGRPRRADRFGKLRQPARDGSAGHRAHQQVRRRLSGQALLRWLRICRRRREAGDRAR